MRRLVRIGDHYYSLSTRKNKKLMTTVLTPSGKLERVHFGDSRHEHFFDRTGLLPLRLNHGDDQRRRLYLARSKHIRDANGRLTALDPSSPNYHARRVLW